MSLLLDALKPTESELGAGVESEALEPPERALDRPEPPDRSEPLDGPATLALLVSKSGAQTALSLVPTSSNATDPPASAAKFVAHDPLESRPLGPSLVGPAPVGLGLAGPEPVAETARTAPNPERAPAAAAGRAAGAAPAPGAHGRRD